MIEVLGQNVFCYFVGHPLFNLSCKKPEAFAACAPETQYMTQIRQKQKCLEKLTVWISTQDRPSTFLRLLLCGRCLTLMHYAVIDSASWFEIIPYTCYGSINVLSLAA